MISEFCIRRPVATLLMSLALVLAGLAAWRVLPVAALPSAEYPVVNVSAALPGASPDTMARSVATPLIKQFATIGGIESIATTNALGTTSIAIQFALGRDIDAAAADVQAAIARTQRALPPEMTSPPSYRKVNPADAPILILALTGRTVPLTALDAIAETVISPALSTVDGVAQVTVLGAQKYAVRIEVDPAALAARGIGVDELVAAVKAANATTPLGTLSGADQQLTLTADTGLDDAADFARIVIAERDGRPVRLGDVTRVVDSVERTTAASWYDGDRAILMAVQRQPDANTVAVVDRVRAALPGFAAQLPGDAAIHLLNDRSTSIRDAVADVGRTLALTVCLVVAVIFLFLRRASATVIPAVAVPISLLATLAVMAPLGYSIDNVSLMALTLAVGLVVDDAIVMLENVFRHMEETGAGPFEAALAGAREIGFTIVAISLSLVAVFLPILLMGGVVGRIFREFAVVVAVAILASMVVSLTLTPMLCARLLPRLPAPSGAGHAAPPPGRWTRLYGRALDACLDRPVLVTIVFLAGAAASAWLVETAPKGFFPQEDIGQLLVATEARRDIAFPAMAKLQADVAAVLTASPHVAHVAWSLGGGQSGGAANQGNAFVQLKPRGERPPLDRVLADLRRDLAGVPGIAAYVTPVQNLNLGARSARSQYQLVVQGLDAGETDAWADRIHAAMQVDRTRFVDVATDLDADALQARLVVDRDAAAMLGVDAATLRASLYAGFGSEEISTIYGAADSYPVIVELDPATDWTPERMLSLEIRGASGRLVPLGAFAKVERASGRLTMSQLGQLPAVTVSFDLPPGVALGDAVARIGAITAELGMPASVTTGFSGTARTFQDSLADQGVLIAAAILTIYVVLGMLYESFVHPFTILTGLPSAVVGALLALRVAGMDLSVIAVIGILMLVGIVKKNGIMMVDVAVVLRRGGLPARAAIHGACLTRLRPITMTTLAALAGTLPIALGAGAGAELRQPLGVAVCGGLVVSQLLTLFVTPVLYLVMDRLASLRPAGADAAPAAVPRG